MCTDCSAKESELLHMARENARLITENHHLRMGNEAYEKKLRHMRKLFGKDETRAELEESVLRLVGRNFKQETEICDLRIAITRLGGEA